MDQAISSETRRSTHQAIDSLAFNITHRGYSFAVALLAYDWPVLWPKLHAIVNKWGGNTFGMHLDIESLPRLPY
jgi:hypothetical protein